jgi:hypothetical protein
MPADHVCDAFLQTVDMKKGGVGLASVDEVETRLVRLRG